MILAFTCLLAPIGGTQAGADMVRDRTAYEGMDIKAVPSDHGVALTFDEPLDEYTRPILRTLDRHDARATFFVVGREARERPELVRAIIRHGHEIGNHTWDHTAINADEHPRRSLQRTQREISRITGRTPKLFRPPAGEFDADSIVLVNQLGMTFVTWSLTGLEQYLYPDQIVEHIERELEPGDIVLFHQVGHIESALERILDHVDAQDWNPVTVTRLLRAGGPKSKASIAITAVGVSVG